MAVFRFISLHACLCQRQVRGVLMSVVSPVGGSGFRFVGGVHAVLSVGQVFSVVPVFRISVMSVILDRPPDTIITSAFHRLTDPLSGRTCCFCPASSLIQVPLLANGHFRSGVCGFGGVCGRGFAVCVVPS